MDSTQRIGCTHLATNTRLRVISSNAKSAMGILGVGLVVLDEPGAFDIVGGEMMADALFSGQGKPNSPLKLLIIGTLAPNQVQAGSWYYDLVAAGTKGSVYVRKLQGDPDTWDTWATIRKANPLTAISPQFRHKLLEERDAALGDTRLSARFKSYRLNLPTADESSVLLEVDDYKLLIGRDVPERDGSPIVGVDLGSNRAFSAAVATWANGRTEALAVCPGIPSVAEQERRDKVPRGTYQRLVDDGSLDSGGRSARTARWPSVEHHDRILGMAGAGGLRQVQVTRTPGRCRGRTNRDPQGIVVRSIGGRACRKLVKDGPLSLAESARALLVTSLAHSKVQADTSGNIRMVKKGHKNESRDDVAFALTLTCGAFVRYPPVAVVEPTGPVVVG